MNTGWQTFSVNLTPFVGNVILIRFAFRSDFTVTRDGWFIDDVLVLE